MYSPPYRMLTIALATSTTIVNARSATVHQDRTRRARRQTVHKTALSAATVASSITTTVVWPP